jgi:hypothetical protein|uniref:Uncharacterized protein n=1 Tax=Siphoviridae sp. ct0eR1 TaxID=2825297 RepID=A0A8S5UH94_9CAUD|nr:MAG TPA: hypothetical protein [Siphoviridae sp. ct0eR1]
MSDATVDKAVFAFLASCVGDFAQWPQCSIAALHGNNEGGRLFGVLFRATARNPDDRTVFRIVVTKDDGWRVRVVQLSNHVILDERDADRGTIVSAVNRFIEMAGMVERRES